MMEIGFEQCVPGTNRKLSAYAKTAIAFRDFNRRQKLPRILKVWEYRRLNQITPQARQLDTEKSFRETTPEEVQRRFEAIQDKLSKNVLNDC